MFALLGHICAEYYQQAAGDGVDAGMGFKQYGFGYGGYQWDEIQAVVGGSASKYGNRPVKQQVSQCRAEDTQV